MVKSLGESVKKSLDKFIKNLSIDEVDYMLTGLNKEYERLQRANAESRSVKTNYGVIPYTIWHKVINEEFNWIEYTIEFDWHGETKRFTMMNDDSLNIELAMYNCI